MTHPPAHRPEDGAPCRSSRIPLKRRPFAEIGPTITARFKSVGIGLYGTYPGLFITYLTFSLPFSIWMLVGYFNAIPRELEEAAMVDGATPIGALFRILIPVSLPGIVAVAIFAFITAWGEVLFASFLTTDETTTLAIGLRNYASQSTSTGTS